MLGRGECPEPETGSPRQQREFAYPVRNGANGSRPGGQRESESGLDSDALQGRRDSLLSAHRSQLDMQQDQQQEHRLRRSDQAYDEEAEQSLYTADNDDLGQLEEFERRQYPLSAMAIKQQVGAEQQRRQSINDRLTEAVSDVMEFVREESTRRGKRRSMIRRRGVNTNLTGIGGGGGGFSAGSGSGGAGPPTDEADFDSEEVGSVGLIGGIAGERSPHYRRRRVTRRSLRRSAQSRIYNDSDTGSGASLSQEPGASLALMQPQQQQQQQQQLAQHQHQMAQRYKLQQHGGSMQDGHLMYGKRGTALLIGQHRRHQSADSHGLEAELPTIQQLYYQPGGRGNIESDYGAAEQSADQVGEPIIRPICVGPSPPPLIGSAEGELVAARRKRDEEMEAAVLSAGEDADEETAIHVEQASNSKCSPTGRFIAPKVAPLSSPSAQLIPDEVIVPPNVPFRGRRLPQIPGSGIIKSAADFLHSSIYGGRHERAANLTGAHSVVTAAAAAATPLMMGGPYAGAAHMSDEPEFPSVSESPTVKQAASGPAGELIPSGIVKKQPLGIEALASTSFDGSASINFPRVSFSPTHTVGTGPVPGQQQVVGSATKYHHHHLPHLSGAGGLPPPATASMIAKQAAGGGPQSTVLAAPSQVAAAGGEGAPMTTWTGRTRRGPTRDDEDDWF